jgi:hypothetical protein
LGAVKTVSRLDSRTISPIAAQAVFRLETTKLPAYAGAELPGSGYALIKVGKVIPGDKMDDATRKGMVQQLGNLLAKEEIRLIWRRCAPATRSKSTRLPWKIPGAVTPVSQKPSGLRPAFLHGFLSGR